DGLNENLKAILDDKNNLKDYIRIRQKSVDIINPKTDKVINGYTFLSEDSQKLNDFINIRERKGKHQIDFNADSVVITEKLAKQLGVSVGDKISFKETEEKTVELTITNICENYVYHYVYIGSNHFSQIAKTINFNSIIGQSANYIENKIVENEDLEKISSTFLSNEDVASISFTKDISNVFEDMIKSLSTVVLVLIFSAGLLAFIVLYNLTNINVNERKREIATIKVLGFFDNEVSSYIYRETIVLTLIGIVAGLFAGVVMHSFVIQTAEVDAVMFGRNIAPLSFVWSALLTLAFSLIVNLVIHIKLKKINMVESLKSID
ncbi:MAG: ABC transporter permease, partial [Oscillospiraceae bacterium]